MLLVLSGCFDAPDLIITDQYIEVVKPGQSLGLSKLKVSKLDSIFCYPIEEREVTTYTVINRLSGEQVKGNTSFRIYFNKKYIRYKWQVYENPFLADHYYVDTIRLEPYTWYRLSSELYSASVYFYWNKDEGTYVRRYKPDPGAW